MKDNFVAFSRNLIFFLICATTVVSTLFFLPTTSEFFEFNKFTAFLGITILGLLLWAARTVAEKRFGFTRTPLDIPILIIVATFFVATLSSLDQFISFVGTQGRAWPSFFAMATVAAFYFMATSNLKSKKQVEVILWTLIGATTIAAVIATAAYFGAFLPFDFASLRSFNPLGVVTRLAQLESFVLPITIAQALLAKNKNVRLVSLIFTIIASFSFILIGFIPSYIALAVGLIVLGVGLMKNKLDKTAQGALATIVVFIVLFLTMRYVPQVAKGTIQAWIKAPQDQGNSLNVIGELRLNNSVSWDIATQAIGKRPLFGTGLGTYAYAYTQLKPRVMNSTDQWSVRFDKPSSDFAEILTTTGIFGALAYLIFAIVVLRFVWTLLFKSSQSGIYLPLAAAIVGFIASNFVSTSSLATVIPFFVGLVLLAILAKATDENYVYDITVEIATMKGKFSWFPIGTSNDLLKTNAEGKGAKSQVLPGLFLIVVLAASAFAARYQIAAYRGEYYFHQAALATRSNNGSRTIAFLQQAISANPRVDSYHRNLSDITRTAAITLSQNKDLTDNQKN
ncbi:MAG TPA: O-antigen ligase family protein, partial [Candidatus Saccharimonadales bacterium]|nr:O-antigen ligase family protein [Candidatus Saccharimonadales bacterium]